MRTDTRTTSSPLSATESSLTATAATEAIRQPPPPDAPGAPPGRRWGPDRRARIRRLARLVVVLAALVTGIAAVVVAAEVPGAPVLSSTSTVTWPKAGATPSPTTLFLVPYRPATLDVTVPCDAIRAARGRDGATTILATTVGAPADGLTVRTEPAGDGSAGATSVQVIASGRLVPVDVPDTDCGLGIRADATGLTVTVGDPSGKPAATVPGQQVPEVFAATTDLRGDDARGLALSARTPAWFDNATTPAKSGLVSAQLRLAVIALLLVVLATLLTPTGPAPRTLAELAAGRGRAIVRTRVRRLRRRALSGLRRPRVPARLAVDAVVALSLAWWSIVGPLTDDDGFAAVIARHSGGGDPTNYYRWFDASEIPFASNQRLLALFADQGATPVGVRTMSVLAGFALWLVLTRGVLRPALGPAGRTFAVRAVAALALAAWWMPYDLGARPESTVALGTTLVVALVLRAARGGAAEGRGTSHPVALLAVAALVAGLTVTLAPSGLVAAAPFVLCLPRLVRAVRGPSGEAAREDGAVARVTRALLPAAHLAVVAGLAAVAVVVVFADQSWHGFLVSTDVHEQIGPDQPWYAEWLRYDYLFGDDSWGAAAKRLPVLLGLVLAAAGTVLLVRGSGRASGSGPWLGREPVLLLGLLPAGFALLAVTPSKWSYHFGALAGYGVIGVVAVVVALVRSARQRDRVIAATGTLATLGVVLGAAFAFSGPDAWWAYSGFGMPGSTGPQRPFDSVALWLVVAVGLAAATFVVVRLRARSEGPGPDGEPGPDGGAGPPAVVGSVAALVPVATALVATGTSVALLVSSFAAAGDRGGQYSLAAQDRAAVADPASPAACGLQDRVQVLQTVSGGPLTPVAGSMATMTGFVADGGAADPPPVRPGQTDGTDGTPDTRDGRYSWGSRDGGDGSVGSLTTPWFGLPTVGTRQALAVSVSGRTSDGASLTWEFGRGDQVLATRPVTEAPEPDRGYRGYAATPEQEHQQDEAQDRSLWRTVTVAPADVPAGADRVRLRARDDRTDENGWIALTGPRIVDVLPLSTWLATRGPVLVDWAVALAWPCAGALPRVADGVAQTPGAFVTTPTGPVDPVPNERTPATSPPGDIVPERWTGGTDGLVTGTDSAASFAGLVADGSLREIDTRLPDEPGRRWGRVLVPELGDLDRDAYDTRVTTRTIPGTAGDRWAPPT